MRRMITSVLVSVLFGGFTVAVAQLPPEVQADAYLLEVEQAIDDGNYDRAWDSSKTSSICRRTTTWICRSSTSGTPRPPTR